MSRLAWRGRVNTECLVDFTELSTSLLGYRCRDCPLFMPFNRPPVIAVAYAVLDVLVLLTVPVLRQVKFAVLFVSVQGPYLPSRYRRQSVRRSDVTFWCFTGCRHANNNLRPQIQPSSQNAED